MKLYHIVRPVVTLAFKIYFRKVFYIGGEKIPHGKPLIFSVNHPTGFFEPTVLACVFWDCEFYFITRGDMFRKPFYRRILESLLMIPIFRFKDGFESMRQNTELMQGIQDRLGERKSIMIFSEGTTKTVKRLRPIQKGLARMAFGAYEKFGDIDLQVVPVGLTYSAPHEPRGEVMIQIGDPIPLSNYHALYAENNAKAVNKLTADVEKAMRPCLVHVERETDEDLSERLFELYRHSFPVPPFPVFQKSARRLMAQQEIAHNLNQMADEKREILRGVVSSYFSKLESQNISDIAVAQPYHAELKNLIALILGFLPFLIGWYGHYLPNAYARKIKRERVKFLEFKGPVYAGVAMGATILQYLILFLIGLIGQEPIYWFLFLMLPFCGYYSVIYNELWQNYKACQALKNLKNTSPESSANGTNLVLKLRAEREAILKMVRSAV
jgi:1-acyl-sn-glycerol-3-phosphate acyltransferase